MARAVRGWTMATALAAGLAAASFSRGDPIETMGAGAPAVDSGANRVIGEALYDRAGTPIIVFHYFAVGPDCAPTPVSITLTNPPAHGRFALSEGREPPVSGEAPLWSGADPRAHCLGRLVATRDGAYAPNPGFAGRDQLTVTFKEGDATFDDAIEVNVVTLAPPPPAKPRRARVDPADRTGAGGP